MLEKRFYNGILSLNVLAGTKENAKAIYEATEGHVLIGKLSKNYPTTEAAVTDMSAFLELTDGAISLGLGGGDANQWKMVADIARELDFDHINQVFPAVGYTRGVNGESETWINSLVNPAEKLGYVNIATGPNSGSVEAANVPIKTAIEIIREMGGNAIKLFPMKGLQTVDAYKEIASACGQAGFAIEPTGGINLDNFEEIVTIALEAGVKKVIPHVYSSIVNKETGETNIEDVGKLYQTIQILGDKYGG